MVPVAKSAIGQSDRARAGDFGDLIARPPKGAIGKAHRAPVAGADHHHRWVRPVKGGEFPVGDQQAKGRALLDQHRRAAIIGPDPQEISVALAARRLDELVAGFVAETKRVQHIFPVAAPKDEGLAVGHLPLIGRRVGAAPPGIEMDVLQAANVVNVVHINSAPQRLAGNVAQQMPLAPADVYAVVWIEHFDLQHGGVFAAGRNGVRIGLRLLIGRLPRVVKHHAAERAVIVEPDKRRAALVSLVFRDQKGGAVIRRFVPAGVPQAEMRGHGFPQALQSHRRGNIQMAGEKVIAALRLHRSSAHLAGRVQRFLKGRRIVTDAVALGAIIADGINRGRLRKGRGEAKEENGRAQEVSPLAHDVVGSVPAISPALVVNHHGVIP